MTWLAAIVHGWAAPIATEGDWTPARSGPWGRLEITTLLLEPSPDSISAAGLISQPPRWAFEGRTAAELTNALLAAGLTSAQTRSVMKTRTPSSNETSVVLHPDAALLLSLDPAIRGRVYALLRTSPASTYYQYPFHIRADLASHWLGDGDLSTNTQGLLRRLMYPNGRMAFFSDLPFVLSTINSVAERRHLVSSLLIQPSLMVRVEAPTPAELDAATTYWGRGGREPNVRALLHAMTRKQKPATVELALLLPTLARTRLYTYSAPHTQQFLDCRWTALNFFNEVPDPRWLDETNVTHALLNEFDPAPEPYQLGDMILLRNDEGRIIHSCNYIADTIVFTKNGGDLGQPWVLATLQDIINYYTIADDVPEFIVLRHRP